MCVQQALAIGEGEFMLNDKRKTVRSSLIYSLRTAISTKSCCIRSLCNIFLSHLAAMFSIISFTRKESTPCFSWSKSKVMYIFRACTLQGKSDCGRWDSLESSVNRLCQFLSSMGWGGVGILLFYLMWLIQEGWNGISDLVNCLHYYIIFSWSNVAV